MHNAWLAARASGCGRVLHSAMHNSPLEAQTPSISVVRSEQPRLRRPRPLTHVSAAALPPTVLDRPRVTSFGTSDALRNSSLAAPVSGWSWLRVPPTQRPRAVTSAPPAVLAAAYYIIRSAIARSA